MTFRHRLTVASAAAVAAAIVLASAIIYPIVRSRLIDQLDGELARSSIGVVLAPGPRGGDVVITRADPSSSGLAQILHPDGTVDLAAGARDRLPYGKEELAVARGQRGPTFRNGIYDGEPVRIFTAPLPPPPGSWAPVGAVQVARSLEGVDRTLGQLRVILSLVVLGGLGLAIGLGMWVTRTAAGPVGRLTDALEHVTATGDLTQRVHARGSDEIGRLGAMFNAMMGTVESSVATQRRLVADASHELRTPLASLRLNAEVLSHVDRLPPSEQAKVAKDIVQQIEGLSAVVAGVIELARGADPAPAIWEVLSFDQLVVEVAERARRRAPTIRINTSLRPTSVSGSPEQLERAVSNLVDNAVKWSPPSGEIDISLREGELAIRDHGPGIAEADLPHVFDRFYRAPTARGTPGSGLGLAIVRQIALAHGGSVDAGPANGGGAIVRLRLPLSPSATA